MFVSHRYNKIVGTCYCECVDSFHSKALTNTESACLTTCVEKYMMFQKRVGQRFAEHNMQVQQNQLQGLQG